MGEKPRKFCRYSVRYRNSAKSEPDTAKAASWTPVNARRRNSPSGSIGWATRRSIVTNAAISTAELARSETISALPQPSSLPRTSASTSRKRAVENVASPGQSTRVAFGSRDSLSFQ